MPTYTFKVDAAASVWAETEEEARNAFILSCQEQDEDVQYGELGIYIPGYSELVLTDIHEEDVYCDTMYDGLQEAGY